MTFRVSLTGPKTLLCNLQGFHKTRRGPAHSSVNPPTRRRPIRGKGLHKAVGFYEYELPHNYDPVLSFLHQGGRRDECAGDDDHGAMCDRGLSERLTHG